MLPIGTPTAKVANRPLAGVRRDIELHPASARFHSDRVLASSERLGDGFRALFAHEVLLLDATADSTLAGLLAFVRQCLPPSKAAAVASVAQVISTAMGGAEGGGGAAVGASLDDRFAQRLKELRLHSVGELPIGLVFGCGLQRHRAVLLKYVIDALRLCDCALVGGGLLTRQDADHLEAVLPLVRPHAGAPWLLVDCMESPGALQEVPQAALVHLERAERERPRPPPSESSASSGSPASAAAWRTPSWPASPASAEGPAAASMSPVVRRAAEAIAAAVRAMDLGAAVDRATVYVAHRPLEPERRPIIEAAFPEVRTSTLALAVTARDEVSGAIRELVAIVPAGASKGLEALPMTLVMGACQVTGEALSPSECVEIDVHSHGVGGGSGAWKLARLGRQALGEDAAQEGGALEPRAGLRVWSAAGLRYEALPEPRGQERAAWWGKVVGSLDTMARVPSEPRVSKKKSSRRRARACC